MAAVVVPRQGELGTPRPVAISVGGGDGAKGAAAESDHDGGGGWSEARKARAARLLLLANGAATFAMSISMQVRSPGVVGGRMARPVGHLLATKEMACTSRQAVRQGLHHLFSANGAGMLVHPDGSRSSSPARNQRDGM